ncbi:chemotaxis protein CheW [Sphingomonas morindae]|uniref:histidine kinase n=1 Tax=Sphingomonas morindae TaxID=1541170 RepID=A0ABY4X4V0_9SPHN|nr:chemotaxis protein CheW [Sphingomonas morindae]USI71914.1 chemotaxis protein CheW [Sphingomonas morindae]
MAEIDPAPPASMEIALPAHLHTLAALRLPALLGAAAADAAGVETIGIAALQWLARRPDPLLLRPSAACIAAAHAAGLAAPLLGLSPPPPPAGARRMTIRFDDGALNFGREPLDGLAALAATGARLIAEPLPERADAPIDAISFVFTALVPEDADAAALADLFAEFEPHCAIQWAAPAAAADAPAGPLSAPTAPSALPAPAAPSGGGDAPETKLARLIALVDELAIAQSVLIDALGPDRGALAAEIGDAERIQRMLQHAIAELGAAPMDRLLGLDAAGWRWDGPRLELEAVVMTGIAEALAPALAARPGGSASARFEDGGVRLELAPAPAVNEALARAVKAVGGRIESEAPALALRLPRSLSLVDALIVRLGEDRYALPVALMVEALRPAPDALHRIGRDGLMLRFGQAYIPVVALGARLGAPRWEADPGAAVLVVVEGEQGRRALLVDAIDEQRQITVKPIAGGLNRLPGVAGAAIVRGNRVALVVDLPALLREGAD